MKSYIKGIITGFAAGLALTFTFAMADNIEVALNKVRLNINGVDTVQWGENITSGGEETPSSILYNGTTYLPMRKLGEWYGKKIYWNGDSATVSVTGGQENVKALAEKPDADGNVWTYYTFDSDYDNYNQNNPNIRGHYLGIKDEARGFERVYRLGSNVYVTDNELYFFKRNENNQYRYGRTGSLVKLSFDNHTDSQDGEIIYTLPSFNGATIIDDEYLYFYMAVPGNASHDELNVLNYKTGQSAMFRSHTWSSLSATCKENTSERIVFSYTQHGTGVLDGEVVYDKATNTFGTPTEKVREPESPAASE